MLVCFLESKPWPQQFPQVEGHVNGFTFTQKSIRNPWFVLVLQCFCHQICVLWSASLATKREIVMGRIWLACLVDDSWFVDGLWLVELLVHGCLYDQNPVNFPLVHIKTLTWQLFMDVHPSCSWMFILPQKTIFAKILKVWVHFALFSSGNPWNNLRYKDTTNGCYQPNSRGNPQQNQTQTVPRPQIFMGS